MQFSWSIPSWFGIKTKIIQGTHNLKEQCHLASEFEKEKAAKKITEFHCIVLFQSQEESIQHSEPTFSLFFFYPAHWEKRAESWVAQGATEPDHICSCSLDTHPGGQQGIGAQPGARMLHPTSHQLTLLGAMGTRSTKISLAWWGRGEPPGNQGRLEKYEAGDRASWPIFPNDFIGRFG